MTHPGSFTAVGPTSPPPAAPIDTGAWFVVGAGGSGPVGHVTRLRSLADYTAVHGPRAVDNTVICDSLELFFRSGGAVAQLVTVAPGAEFADDAADALDLFPATLGCGQVSIPGAVDATTHAAIAAHASAANRTAILDGPDVAAATLVTAGEATRTAVADEAVYGLFAGWPMLGPLAPGDPFRTVPPCGGVAGRINAVDARTGHANAAAAADQGWGAGRLTAALGISRVYTDAEWDDLTVAGVNLLVPDANGRIEIYGWRTGAQGSSPGTVDPVRTWLNHRRLNMQITAAVKSIGKAFVFRVNEGVPLFTDFAHALRGYMIASLFNQGALWGTDADDAFVIDTIGPNTAEVSGAGELLANVDYTPAGVAERVTTQISVSAITSTEVAA
jgi:hypothetical protein